jgi:hypothetical protein
MVPRSKIQEPGKKGPHVLKEVHICQGLNCEAKDPILDFRINNVPFVKLIMTLF